MINFSGHGFDWALIKRIALMHYKDVATIAKFKQNAQLLTHTEVTFKSDDFT